MTLEEWMKEGTPRKAGTLCGKNCRCDLLPVGITEEAIQAEINKLIDESVEKAISGIKIDFKKGGSVLLKEFEQYEGILTLAYERIAYMESLIADWKFKEIDKPRTLPKEFFKLADLEDMIDWLKKELRNG
jgi:hypothetical protein